MNIIDALFVTLGLDASGMKKGAAEAGKAQEKIEKDAQRTAKTISKTEKDTAAQRKKGSDASTKQNKEAVEQAKKTAEAIKQVSAQVLGLFAIFTAGAGLKSFIANITSADAAAGRTAKNLGISSDELSKWQAVAEQAGGTAEDVATSFTHITQAAYEYARTGSSATQLAFQRIGIDWADANGKLKDMGELALEVADKIKPLNQAAKQGVLQTLGYTEGFGNVISQGREAVAASLKSAKAANDADTAAAGARLSAYVRLTQASEDLGRKILTVVSPALEGVLKILIHVVDFLAEHRGLAVGVFAAITAVVLALTVALSGPLLASIFAVVAALSIPLGLLAAIGLAVGAVAAAAYELYTEWDTVVYGMGKLFDAFVDKLLHPWKAVKDAIHSVLGGPTSAPNPHGGGRGHTVPSAAPAGTPAGTSTAATSNAPASGSRSPRGVRNNNPGNLNYVGQAGATKEGGSGGRFAVFGTMAEGIAALAKQLQRYGKQGTDTVRGIISKFAPPGENNTEAYIKSVMKSLGVSDNEHLDLKNPSVLRELIKGITTVEVGKGKVSVDQINAGLSLGAQGVAGSSTNNTANNTAHTETTIGSITVHTQATDAKGLAQGIGSALEKYAFVPQVNTGVN